MMMLVLMQFDVYGYDFISASRQADVETFAISFGDGQVVSETQSVVSEWSDPVYKNPLRRFFADIISLVLVVSFLLLPVCENSKHEKLVNISNPFDKQETYLRFKVLLI